MQCSWRFPCGLALIMSVSLHVAPRVLAPELGGTQGPAAAPRATLPWQQTPGAAYTEMVKSRAGAVHRNLKQVRTSPSSILPGQLDEQTGDADDVFDSPERYSETPLDPEWSDNAVWGDSPAAANSFIIVLCGEN